MIKFRHITAEDYEDVGRLMCELHGVHAEGRPDIYSPMTELPSFEEFCEHVTGEDRFGLCAEEGGEVIAYALVQFRTGREGARLKTALLSDIYVTPQARRGKIGTMLYRMAEREAREQGAVRLDLIVWDFNDEAAAFYRKMGFRTQRVIMEKDITVENFERECEK